MTNPAQLPHPLSNNTATRKNPLVTLTVLYLLLLAVLWLAESFVAEKHWLTTALLYFPQHWIGVPGVLLTLWSARRRHRRALGLNLLALGWFCFYFLGFNVPVRGGSTPGATTIRVMTYNIHYGSTGAQRVVDAVRQQNPDILCLQETRAFKRWGDPVPKLQRLLPGWHMARGAEVTTFSRHPIVSQRAHPMQQPTGRVTLETVVDVRGQKLSVFNTHISTFGNANRGRISLYTPRWLIPGYVQVTADVRAQQLPFLLSAASRATTPAIICGDFNNPPRGRFYRRLTRDYKDAFAVAGWGTGYTFRSDLPLIRIDHILAGQGVRVNSCFVPRVFASDHRPVVAEISMGRN